MIEKIVASRRSFSENDDPRARRCKREYRFRDLDQQERRDAARRSSSRGPPREARRRSSSSARAAPARSCWRAPSTPRVAARTTGRSSRFDCAALDRDAARDRELFGHEKGAFTGARPGARGRVRGRARRHAVPRRDRRHRPPKLQLELLRVLEDARGRARRRHASRSPSTCASSRRPTATCRSAVARRRVPRGSLLPAERRSRSRCRRCASGGKTSRCSSSTSSSELAVELKQAGRRACRRRRWRSLLAHSWPGNVRELRNVIERGMVVCPVRCSSRPTSASTLRGEAMPAHAQRLARRGRAAAHRLDSGATDGNISQAARVLAIDRATLYSKIRK